MKQDMSSADVAAVVAELSAGPKSIIDAKIGKIYQPTNEEIRINLYVFHQGRDNLVIEAGKRIHLSKYIRASPKLPQAFPMLLRKYLMGGRIVSIEQHDFDRIVKIGIERGGIRSTLIVELFARGNVLIVDSENRIILPMNPVTLKDRRLRSGEIYELPEAQLSPLEARVSDLMEAFSRSSLRRKQPKKTHCDSAMQCMNSFPRCSGQEPERKVSEKQKAGLKPKLLNSGPSM